MKKGRVHVFADINRNGQFDGYLWGFCDKTKHLGEDKNDSVYIGFVDIPFDPNDPKLRAAAALKATKWNKKLEKDEEDKRQRESLELKMREEEKKEELKTQALENISSILALEQK